MVARNSNQTCYSHLLLINKQLFHDLHAPLSQKIDMVSCNVTSRVFSKLSFPSFQQSKNVKSKWIRCVSLLNRRTKWRRRRFKNTRDCVMKLKRLEKCWARWLMVRTSISSWTPLLPSPPLCRMNITLMNAHLPIFPRFRSQRRRGAYCADFWGQAIRFQIPTKNGAEAARILRLLLILIWVLKKI